MFFFCPQSFNRSCKLRISIAIEERKENRWKVKKTLVEIKRIENSQCNNIKGFVLLTMKMKWNQNEVTFFNARNCEICFLCPKARQSRTVSHQQGQCVRSQCLFFSRESSSLPDTPAAATHLQHTGALPQESRRQSPAHHRTRVNADASPYDWSSCATCRLKKITRK